MGICSSCCREKAKESTVVIEQPAEDVEVVLATTEEVKKLLSTEASENAPIVVTEASNGAPSEAPVEEAKAENVEKPVVEAAAAEKPAVQEAAEQPADLVSPPTETPTYSFPDDGPPSPANTRLEGEVGYGLSFGLTNGGTLSARWVKKVTGSIVAIARVETEVDEIKLSDPAFDCGKNVKAEWMNQAKALCIYLRQCFQQKAEVELRPEFLTVLPRKAMVIAHRTDGKLVTIKAPAVLDFAAHDVDGVAVLPVGADVYKGYTSQKLHQFLEKGVRKGATLRFQ